MKEVLAIIQMNKMESTKDALDVIGIPSITVYKASGRGKQRGLQILHPSPLAESDQKSMKYIPKRVISIRSGCSGSYHQSQPHRKLWRWQDLRLSCGRIHPHKNRRERERGPIMSGREPITVLKSKQVVE
jgi:hypothetical protein